MDAGLDTIEIAGRRVRIVRRLPLIYEDLRPGREGRKAPATLLNEPSIDRLRELFEYEAESGLLRWRVSPGRRVKSGDVAGRIRPDGYRGTKIEGIEYQTHGLVWAIVNGAWPDYELDH